MSRPGHRDRDKDKYDAPNTRRTHSIMSPEDFNAGKKSHWPELEITGAVRNLSQALFYMKHLTALYLNDNNLARIPPDINRLENLTHLDLSSNKLRSIPPELGDLIKLRELLLNNNYLRMLPYELGRLFKIHTLGLNKNPLTQEILVIYNEPNGTQKLLSYLLDNLTVNMINRPPARPWMTLGHPTNTDQPAALFTVMSYNILCDKMATRQLYGYCPSWALAWDYRRKLIIDEIRQFGADIIALQEVETEQFYKFFQPELKSDYEAIFSPKSRAKTMSEKDRKHVDGCAIFYRTSKFSLIKEHLVEFNQMAMANAEGSDDMLNRVMTKDNIGMAALLQTKEDAFEPRLESGATGQPILVSTAHMHLDPEDCDVKLIQTMMLMHELRQIVEDSTHSFRPGAQKADANSIPLIFCADLNSLPDSGVVEFLASGRVSTDHVDFKELGYKDCLRKLSASNDINKAEFTHPFRINRAYSEDVMPFTNYTFDFKGVIDYIFYSKQHLSVLGLLGALDGAWLKENKIAGCPSPYNPSDHLPLLAEFEMLYQSPTGSSSTSGSTSSSQATNSTSSSSASSRELSTNGLLHRR